MESALFQFTVRRLMLLVLIVAVTMTLYQSLNRMWVVVGTTGSVGAVFTWLLVRHRRRMAAWGFGIASIGGNVLILLTCSEGVSIGAYGAMILVSLLVLPVAFGCGVELARLEPRQSSKGLRLARIMVLVLCLMPLTMIATLWPLRLAFLVSRPALNAMADRVSAGRPVVGREWAGWYEVVRSKFDPLTGEVALIIDDDPAGRSGFLRIASGHPTQQSDLFVNLNFSEYMDERWRYQNED